MAIMLPSLREERAATYSPFLPISPRTGIVLQVPVIAHDAKAGTITYEDPDNAKRRHHAGHRRPLQAAMEAGLGDALGRARHRLRDGRQGPDRLGRSCRGEICRALGGTPPEGFNYELFLDEKGQKISKSKGNGLTIDEWLRYASPESLSLFMYREPKAAKRLLFRRHPARRRRLSAVPRRLSAAGRQAATVAIRSGTSMLAIRRPSKCRSRSRCC